MDLESTLNWIILRIDKNQETMDEFKNDTLFMNIYYFYCFSQYLSPCKWEKEALKRLKQNIILKWPKETFGDVVFVFIELLSRGYKEVNPTGYFSNSEDYFERLLKTDILKDNLIFKRIFKKGKCVR